MDRRPGYRPRRANQSRCPRPTTKRVLRMRSRVGRAASPTSHPSDGCGRKRVSVEHGARLEAARSASSVSPLLDAIRHHWPEYLMEAAELGIFMVSACFVTALLEYPSSPVRQALPIALVRHALAGLAMGLTAVAI